MLDDQVIGTQSALNVCITDHFGMRHAEIRCPERISRALMESLVFFGYQSDVNVNAK